jgi:DNA polymerase-3 subunit delta'
VSWQRVKGHDELIEAFARAVARGRLAHAYLFIGPPGVGKRLFAHELAKTLLCESPYEGRFDACDSCAACHLMDGGTHPDFFALARPADKQEMPIDVVRRLCDDLAMKPARGGRKIAVLDDADDLNDESANAFLKTLEEPPPRSLLVLIATSADRQLPTIRSRCQVVPFAPLPEETLIAVLGADAAVDPALAGRLARLSDGSPGLAREFADADLWAYRSQFFRALTQSNPDSPTLARRLVEMVESVGKDAGAQRRRAGLIVRMLVDGFCQALARGTGGSPAADAADGPLLEQLAQKLGADGLLRRLERCLEADMQIERRVQLVLVLEGLMDALAYG